jgi:hypothetical protein
LNYSSGCGRALRIVKCRGGYAPENAPFKKLSTLLEIGTQFAYSPVKGVTHENQEDHDPR